MQAYFSLQLFSPKSNVDETANFLALFFLKTKLHAGLIKVLEYQSFRLNILAQIIQLYTIEVPFQYQRTDATKSDLTVHVRLVSSPIYTVTLLGLSSIIGRL